MARVSEEMKAWSAALASEVETWPQVSTRAFFAFTAIYRKKQIFGLLPRTRGIETPHSIAFKVESPSTATRKQLQSDPRVDCTHLQKGSWFRFEISTDEDLRGGLKWLTKAYDLARKQPKIKCSRTLVIQITAGYTNF
jgi:hypothetical protein